MPLGDGHDHGLRAPSTGPSRLPAFKHPPSAILKDCPELPTAFDGRRSWLEELKGSLD